MDYLCNCKSEISNVYNAVESHCLQAMKIVRHYANGRFDWLISGHQSVNPSREAISILSGKYKRFTFVHPVDLPLSFVSGIKTHSLRAPQRDVLSDKMVLWVVTHIFYFMFC